MRRLITAFVLVTFLASGCGAAKKANDARRAVNDIKKTSENLDKGTTGDKDLDAFIARADKAKTLTYTAAYAVTQKGGGSPSTMRIVQAPPKARLEFAESDGGKTIYIDDGTDTINCFITKEVTKPTCNTNKGAGGHADDFQAAGLLFNPVQILAYMKAFVPLLGTKVQTKKLSKPLAGASADCYEFTVKQDDKTAPTVSTYCLNADGVFAYSDDGSTTSELTSYSTKADPADLKAPAGAQSLDDLTTSTTSASSTTTTEDNGNTNAADETTTTTQG